MEKIEINFFDNFPKELQNIIKNELDDLKVEYQIIDRPLSNDFITPTLIICITFIAKPFFTAFLTEFGKDFYKWIKIKTGLFKLKEKSPLQVGYHIKIGEARFIDYHTYAYSDKRHEDIIKAVNQVINIYPVDSFKLVKTVILRYDSEKKKYISADLYSTESITSRNTVGKLGVIEPLVINLETSKLNQE